MADLPKPRFVPRPNRFDRRTELLADKSGWDANGSPVDELILSPEQIAAFEAIERERAALRSVEPREITAKPTERLEPDRSYLAPTHAQFAEQQASRARRHMLAAMLLLGIGLGLGVAAAMGWVR
jgi:hypothetical protein